MEKEQFDCNSLLTWSMDDEGFEREETTYGRYIISFERILRLDAFDSLCRRVRASAGARHAGAGSGDSFHPLGFDTCQGHSRISRRAPSAHFGPPKL
ncbi:hypothetical protein K503DRAFT_769314, partial [Rhizopogon vinicolor AM-OR11-026]